MKRWRATSRWCAAIRARIPRPSSFVDVRLHTGHGALQPSITGGRNAHLLREGLVERTFRRVPDRLCDADDGVAGLTELRCGAVHAYATQITIRRLADKPCKPLDEHGAAHADQLRQLGKRPVVPEPP